MFRTYNCRTQKVKAGQFKFKVSLGNIMNAHLNYSGNSFLKMKDQGCCSKIEYLPKMHDPSTEGEAANKINYPF